LVNDPDGYFDKRLSPSPVYHEVGEIGKKGFSPSFATSFTGFSVSFVTTTTQKAFLKESQQGWLEQVCVSASDAASP